eukprot:m.255207 g.255207  ORF g.255207 m.255207 type:complete len:942 (+) comp19158_c1_seq1:338-3163(+)
MGNNTSAELGHDFAAEDTASLPDASGRTVGSPSSLLQKSTAECYTLLKPEPVGSYFVYIDSCHETKLAVRTTDGVRHEDILRNFGRCRLDIWGGDDQPEFDSLASLLAYYTEGNQQAGTDDGLAPVITLAADNPLFLLEEPPDDTSPSETLERSGSRRQSIQRRNSVRSPLQRGSAHGSSARASTRSSARSSVRKASLGVPSAGESAPGSFVRRRSSRRSSRHSTRRSTRRPSADSTEALEAPGTPRSARVVKPTDAILADLPPEDAVPIPSPPAPKTAPAPAAPAQPATPARLGPRAAAQRIVSAMPLSRSNQGSVVGNSPRKFQVASDSMGSADPEESPYMMPVNLGTQSAAADVESPEDIYAWARGKDPQLPLGQPSPAWLYGPYMSREEVEDLIEAKGKVDGMFLVRERPRQKRTKQGYTVSYFVLTCVLASRIEHHLIGRSDINGTYSLPSSRTLPATVRNAKTLSHLVHQLLSVKWLKKALVIPTVRCEEDDMPEWMHRDVTRKQIKRMLVNSPDGSFLVRLNPNFKRQGLSYFLSIVHGQAIHHHVLVPRADGLWEVDGVVLASCRTMREVILGLQLDETFEHPFEHVIPRRPPALVIPFPRQLSVDDLVRLSVPGKFVFQDLRKAGQQQDDAAAQLAYSLAARETAITVDRPGQGAHPTAASSGPGSVATMTPAPAPPLRPSRASAAAASATKGREARMAEEAEAQRKAAANDAAEIERKRQEGEAAVAAQAKAELADKQQRFAKAAEERAKTHEEVSPPKLAPVSRKYATEDERIAAEADVTATSARLENLDFGFKFESGAGSKSNEPAAKDEADKSAAAKSDAPLSFAWSAPTPEKPSNPTPEPPEEQPSAASARTSKKASVADSLDAYALPQDVLDKSKSKTVTATGPPSKLGPVSRDYATEDERIAAEADVGATEARLSEVSFAFKWGD